MKWSTIAAVVLSWVGACAAAGWLAMVCA